jgi:hypothetical protein
VDAAECLVHVRVLATRGFIMPTLGQTVEAPKSLNASPSTMPSSTTPIPLCTVGRMSLLRLATALCGTPGSLLHVVPAGSTFPAVYAGLAPGPISTASRNGNPSTIASSSRPRLTLLSLPLAIRINHRCCIDNTSAGQI